MINDIWVMERAAAKSDQKISRQLQQASARLRQRKGGQYKIIRCKTV